MKSLIIDTNLLLVLFIGNYSLNRISEFSITSKYSKSDYVSINNWITKYKKIYFTPQILAEVSNMSEVIKNEGLKIYYQKLIRILKNFNEEYINKNILIKNISFLSRLGFADLSIIECALKNKSDILTDDRDLHYACFEKKGLTSFYYTQIKGQEWFSESS